jgi:hypothetical protein
METSLELRPAVKRAKGDNPDAVAKALEALARRSGGVLTPDQVLAAAARTNSPLHGYFTWDDTEAARAWRLHQARQLIASVKVQLIGPTGPQEPIRAWVSVQTDEGRTYRALPALLADPTSRNDLLAAALRELERVRRQYGQLEELAAVWSALDKAAA